MSVGTPSSDPKLTGDQQRTTLDRWLVCCTALLALIVLWLVHAPWWLVAAVGVGLTAGTLPGILVRYRRRSGSHERFPWLRWRGRGKYIVPLDVPPAPRHFVGREQDIERMRAHLSGTAAALRVVAITGAAGIGKTALATRFALLVEGEFPDGQLFSFVSQPADTSDGVLRTLGSFIKALQLPRRSVPGALEARARRYARLTRYRKIIVVLDDVDGVDVHALRKLFPTGPDCAVVLTSREPVPGIDALSIRLEKLSERDAVDLLGSVVGDKRVAGDPQAARSIVNRSSGFPLSLRLAGASLAARPHLALKLAVDRMREVPSGEAQPDAGTLDLSFALLTDDEQRAFCCLGLLDDRVFAPWMLAALMGVEEDRAGRLSDSLSFLGLVQRSSNEGSGLVRFRVHEHVLAYARAMADSQMTPQARVDLREALAAARQERDDRDLPALLTVQIPRLESAGSLAEAANVARDVLDQIRRQDRPRPVEEALALASLAALQVEVGNTQAALEFVAKANKAAEGAVIPLALRVEGKALRRLRRIEEAHQVLRTALEALDVADVADAAERIRVLRELSAALALGTRPDQALPYALEAVRLCDSHPDLRPLLPSALWAQGNALFRTNRGDEAASCLEEAERIAAWIEAEQAEPNSQLLWKAWIAELSAEVAASLGDHAAEKFTATAMARFTTARHRYGTAYCQLVLGRFYQKGNDRLDDAEALLTEALRNFQSCEDPWIEAETSRVLGIVRWLREDQAEAFALLDSAWREFRRLGDETSADAVAVVLGAIPIRPRKSASEQEAVKAEH